MSLLCCWFACVWIINVCRSRAALESELLKLREYKSDLESSVEQLQQDESDHQLRVERLAEEIKLHQLYAHIE